MTDCAEAPAEGMPVRTADGRKRGLCGGGGGAGDGGKQRRHIRHLLILQIARIAIRRLLYRMRPDPPVHACLWMD